MIAAALLAALSTASSGMIAASELFILPWSALAVLLALSASTASTGRRRLLLLAAGLAAGIAIQVKLLAAVELAIVALAALGGMPRRERSVGLICETLALIGVAAALPTVGVILAYASAHQTGILRYANLTYNGLYAARATLHPKELAAFLATTAIRFSPLWALCALAICHWRIGRRGVLLCAAWACVVLLAACTTKRFYAHYSLTLLPPLSVLSGMAVPALAAVQRRGARRLIVTLALLGVVPFAIYNITRERRDQTTRAELAAIARLIPAYARPGDFVYLANNDPAFYITTHTRPATYWIFPQWLGDKRWTDVSNVDWRTELDQIIDRRPALIVVRAASETWDPEAVAFFEGHLSGRYRMVQEMAGVRAYVPAAQPPVPTVAP